MTTPRYNEDPARFSEIGYVVRRGLLERDLVAHLRSVLEGSLRDSESTVLARYGVDYRASNAPSRIAAALAEHPDMPRADQQILIGHFSLETRLSPELQKVARSEAVQAALSDLLGQAALRMHMPPTSRFVLPGNQAAAVPAHQDVAYNGHLSQFVVMWMPMVPITAECGGMVIFEGSHGRVQPASARDEGGWINAIACEDYDPVQLHPLSPGDAVFMSSTIIHQSMPNLSSEVRYSTDFRFFGGADSSGKHYLDMSTWQVVDPT